MKLISCRDGKLHALEAGASAAPTAKAFRTGLAALDALPPGGAFARGAVHELLTAPADGQPLFFAALLAEAGSRDKETRGKGDGETWGRGDEEEEAEGAASSSSGPLVPLSPCPLVPSPSSAIVWSDPRGELYPPALAALGIPLERMFLLHPRDEADQVWAVAECLRCRGVAAVVAALPHRLSRVAARRLQLAAEQGGGVGLLLRPAGRASAEHAAVTRWLVGPAPGERNVQRWRIQLVFGHGGRVGQTIILEHRRDTTTTTRAAAGQRVRPVEAHPVRPAAELADRPAAPGVSARAGAARRRTG